MESYFSKITGLSVVYTTPVNGYICNLVDDVYFSTFLTVFFKLFNKVTSLVRSFSQA